MRISRTVVVAAIALTIVAPCIPAQTASQPNATQKPQPADVVQKLYDEVIISHPLGVPTGAARTAIWPLLSKRLIKAFGTRNACDLDWSRQHPNANVPPYILKPPGFFEDGLFSGSDEAGYINGASVERATMEKDGSYLVYVNIWSYLDGGPESLRIQKKYRWQVGARVISEDGRFVVDDIRFFKNALDNGTSVWMSRMIRAGCPGLSCDPAFAPKPLTRLR